MTVPSDGFFERLESEGLKALAQETLEESVAATPAAQVLDQYGDFSTPDAWSVMSYATDLAVEAATGLYDDTARVLAGGMRNECLSIRLPGIPGGEYIAQAADWWAGEAVEAFGAAPRALGRINDSMNSTIQNTLGIPGAPPPPDEKRPHAQAGFAPGDDGFLVQVPGWQDIFQFNNDSMFSDRDKKDRTADAREAMERSPTPPNLQEIGVLLTALDDVQDEVATLAIVMKIAQKLAGRRIPGIGKVSTTAEALSAIYALSNVATGSGIPGKGGKRRLHEKGKHSKNGLRGKWNQFKRVTKLKVGIGAILEGLQATDSMFGVGIQLGGIMGFLQDGFWGTVRGAEFQGRGPLWDPLGFTEYGRNACYRSPSLDLIHPRAYFMMANTALSVWKKTARVMPYIDTLGENALASALTGMSMAEQVLGPWLRSGVWVDPLVRALEINPVVAGGVEAHDTRGLRADEWLSRTVPASRVGMMRAIDNVRDRGRQSFYETLVASTGWGIMADLEPGAKVLNQEVGGPIKDAILLLDANRIPVFDLED
jgi:hypothetical protein